jgi:hypothetical protein
MKHVTIALLAGLGLLSTAGFPAAAQMSDEELIKNATAAAPAAVGANATVIAFDENMQVRTVREGTNNFTCIPDNPESPGVDPMCLDENGMLWAQAWMSQEPPPEGKIGFGYMLMGGSDASNTDPFAAGPAPDGGEWVETGPHVMIFNVGAGMQGYPSQRDNPDTKAPYVMWAGTPYEHLMIPVE